MRRPNARALRDDEPLTAAIIHSTLRSLFPRKNDYGDGSFAELVPELAKFNVTTRKTFRLLMKKHRRALLEGEKSRLSPVWIQYYRQEFGDQFVSDAIRRQYWFAYPGLVRNAAEFEFGEAASVYVDAAIES